MTKPLPPIHDDFFGARVDGFYPFVRGDVATDATGFMAVGL